MKTKNDFFMKVYRMRWGAPGAYGVGNRWGAETFREVFGNKGRLPRYAHNEISYSVDGTMSIELLLVEATPKCRKHRVFVFCNKCGTFVPAGRIHQHKC